MVFKGNNFNCLYVLNVANKNVCNRLMVASTIKRTDQDREALISWTFPPMEWIKGNVDDSVGQGSGKAACGRCV